MNIKVERYFFGEKATIGNFSIDGKYQCLTLEDKVRPARERKVYGETAIPAGTYTVTLRTEGTIHAAYLKRFPDMHKGTLWIRNIPGYEYVLIHCGNTPEDTLGCILVGTSLVDDTRISGSERAYKKIYPSIADALVAGEEVKIEIVNERKP